MAEWIYLHIINGDWIKAWGIFETAFKELFLVATYRSMYLIAAEAEFKIGKLDSAAYYINIVRTRVAQPGHVAEMQSESLEP